MSDSAVLKEVEMSERVIRVVFKKRQHPKEGARFLHQILGLRMGVSPERGSQNKQPGGKPQASEKAPIAKRLEGSAGNPGKDEESKDAPHPDANSEKPSFGDGFEIVSQAGYQPIQGKECNKRKGARQGPPIIPEKERGAVALGIRFLFQNTDDEKQQAAKEQT